MSPLIAEIGPKAGAARHFKAGGIAFVCAPTPPALDCHERLVRLYGNASPNEADIVVALGGDGFMLETLHLVLGRDIPVYGMNCGSVGFLMNAFGEANLPLRLNTAQEAILHPLRMHAVTVTGRSRKRWRSTR